MDKEESQDSGRTRGFSLNPLSIYPILGGVLFLVQFFFLVFDYNVQANAILLGIGWVLLLPSFILASAAVSALKPDVALDSDERSARHVSLVESGPYAIIRHPLYVGWFMMSAALGLILQNLASLILFLLQACLIVALVFAEERSNVLKFGEPFQEYCSRVPRTNFAIGIFRHVRPGREQSALLEG